MFSALVMAGTYLNRIAEYVTQGAPPGMIGQLTVLLLPAILVQTFPMAVLLAALLSFGRLSSDSEIVALRAAGASIYRIVTPVILFSLLIAGLSFWANEQWVPMAAKRSVQIMDQLARDRDASLTMDASYPIKKEGRLEGYVIAQNVRVVSATQASLAGATIVSYDEQGAPAWYLFADELEFDPVQFKEGNGWRIRGEAKLTSADGASTLAIKGGAWPEQIDVPNFNPQEMLLNRLRSFETLSMVELREQIKKGIETGEMSQKELRNYQYGYYNKIALPLAALVFGSLGATLGIRNHRTGTAAGFALAVSIIFGYIALANFMNVWALGGIIPPYVASFTPLTIGLICSGIILWRRNA